MTRVYGIYPWWQKQSRPHKMWHGQEPNGWVEILPLLLLLLVFL